MIIIICPNCNKVISYEAKECPHCGYDLSIRPHRSLEDSEDTSQEQEPYKRKKNYNWLIKLAITVVVIAVVALVAHYYLKPIPAPAPETTVTEEEISTAATTVASKAVSGDSLKGKLEGKTFVLLGDPGDFGLYQEITFKKGNAILFVSNEAEANKYTEKYTVKDDEITVEFDAKYDVYDLTFMADENDDFIKYHSVTKSKMSDFKADFISFLMLKKDFKENGSKKLATELDKKTVESEFFAKLTNSPKGKSKITLVSTVDKDSVFSSLTFEAPGIKTDNVGKTVNDNLAVFTLRTDEMGNEQYRIYLMKKDKNYQAIIIDDNGIAATETWVLK